MRKTLITCSMALALAVGGACGGGDKTPATAANASRPTVTGDTGHAAVAPAAATLDPCKLAATEVDAMAGLTTERKARDAHTCQYIESPSGKSVVIMVNMFAGSVATALANQKSLGPTAGTPITDLPDAYQTGIGAQVEAFRGSQMITVGGGPTLAVNVAVLRAFLS
jgi:hypothetical protein